MSAADSAGSGERRRPRSTWPFWFAVAGVVGYIGLSIWLDHSLGWPNRYGFNCRGRACLLEEVWYSPRLITRGHGSLREWTLFGLIWLLVPLPLLPFLWPLVKKRRRLTIFEPASKD